MEREECTRKKLIDERDLRMGRKLEKFDKLLLDG